MNAALGFVPGAAFRFARVACDAAHGFVRSAREGWRYRAGLLKFGNDDEGSV
jgi:hypothetical protein